MSTPKKEICWECTGDGRMGDGEPCKICRGTGELPEPKKRGKYNKIIHIPHKPKPCETHKQKNKELGYLAWHAWADDQRKKKQKQIQCPNCGFWLFPEEI